MDVTDGYFTWTLSGTPTVRYDVTGDPCVVGACTVTAISPGPSTVGGKDINGSMVNPDMSGYSLDTDLTQLTPPTYGFDGRLIADGGLGVPSYYDSAKNKALSLPLTLNPGDSLVSCESYVDAGLTNDIAAIYSYWSSNPHAIKYMGCLSSVPSDPGPDGTFFRPPPYGSVKPLWKVSDIFSSEPSYSYSPDPKGTAFENLHIDAGSAYPGEVDTVDNHGHVRLPAANIPDVSGLKRLQWMLVPNNGVSNTTSLVRPTYQMQVYPVYFARCYSQLAVYSLGNFASSQTFLYRVLKLGIDAFAAHKCTIYPLSLGEGGFGMGSALLPIMMAGYFFRNDAMLNMGSYLPSKFTVLGGGGVGADTQVMPWWGDQTMAWYSPNALSAYRLPKPRSRYAFGPPLYGQAPFINVRDPPDGLGQPGNSVIRDPYGVYDEIDDLAAVRSSVTGYSRYRYSDVIGAYLSANLQVFVAKVIATYILGIQNKWNSQCFLDWTARWVFDPYSSNGFGTSYTYTSHNAFAEDIYIYGGSGNGWMQAMWAQFGPPPEITTPSAPKKYYAMNF